MIPIRFVDCQSDTSPPNRIILHRYLVASEGVPALEAYLGRKFGMAPLRFRCCYWGPNRIDGQDPFGRFRYNGFNYEIALYSPGTLIYDLRFRALIPPYELVVTKYLDEP